MEKKLCDTCRHNDWGQCDAWMDDPMENHPIPVGRGVTRCARYSELALDKTGGVFICDRCAKQSTHKCLPDCRNVCKGFIEKTS